MMSRLLESIENASWKHLLGIVGLLVIAGQLVAISAVAGEQVQRQAQREHALQQERTAQLRCLEQPGQPQGCLLQLASARTPMASAAVSPGAPRPEVYSLHQLAHPLGGMQRVVLQASVQ